jgi:hypothetical protein
MDTPLTLERIRLGLEELAGPRLQALIPELRTQLGENSLGALILGFKDRPYAELYHNCYFDLPDVRELLAMHIEIASGHSKPGGADPELMEWLHKLRGKEH